MANFGEQLSYNQWFDSQKAPFLHLVPTGSHNLLKRIFLLLLQAYFSSLGKIHWAYSFRRGVRIDFGDNQQINKFVLKVYYNFYTI